MGPHRMPAAEVDVSPDLVRRLLATQQPDLAHLPVEVMANGWDNVVCRVGDDLVARLPRREVAATLLVHEQRWLPVLEPRLWMLLPAECHDAFQNAYRAAGEYAASDDSWARARGWALALSLVFLAHSADNPQLAGIGQHTISAVLA